MTKHFFTLIIILILQNSSTFAFTEYTDKTVSKIKPEKIQPYFKTKNDATE